MKLFTQNVCLLNIMGLCWPQEISHYGQCENLNEYCWGFDLEKARLRIRNILHGFVEKSGANLEPRKALKRYEPVSCVDDFSTSCAANKDKFLGDMFESYLFRVLKPCKGFLWIIVGIVLGQPIGKYRPEIKEDEEILW